jgi:hypothetical protein
MGAMSRRKGATGEREFAEVLKRYGFAARRDGRLDDDLDHDVEGWHFEIKRRETLALPSWIGQAITDAKGRKWAVAWRRSREPWRITLDAEDFLALLARATHAEAVQGARSQ